MVLTSVIAWESWESTLQNECPVFRQTISCGLFYALDVLKPFLCLCMDIFLAATVLISNYMLDLLCQAPDFIPKRKIGSGSRLVTQRLCVVTLYWGHRWVVGNNPYMVSLSVVLTAILCSPLTTMLSVTSSADWHRRGDWDMILQYATNDAP
jgi:hypothetical protein